jgi:hypothetical protein
VAAFATPTELAGFLQQDLDTYSATQALDIASQAIRDHCGWSITQESGAVETLDGSGGQSVWLKTKLLTAVTSVTELGISLVATTGFDWTDAGQLIRIGRCWTYRPRSVVVTYTHGFATVPDSVKGVCLAVAGRRFQNPEGLRSQTVGGVSESYTIPATGQIGFFYDTELADLAPYRLAVVA